MTILQAKQISIISYLETLGIDLVKQSNQDYWYKSPLHLEKTASFKVDINKNLWYDHAQGVGGGIIDLVMAINSCDVSYGLKILGGNVNSISFSPVEPTIIKDKKDNFIIVEVKELSNPMLLKYINSRKININIARKFCSEIYFRKRNNNNLFSICFKNDKGGYETRNSLYKGNIGGKAITTIQGKGSGKVAVFEGFMDFLSMLTKFNTDVVTDDIIILNSLSLISKVKDTLMDYDEVKYFLDNDKSGVNAKCDLMTTIGGVDYSYLYKGFKDANEWLVSS